MFKTEKSFQKKDIKESNLSMMNPQVCQTTTRNLLSS